MYLVLDYIKDGGFFVKTLTSPLQVLLSTNNSYFIMNAFKTVVMICAMLVASSSGQYLSQSSNQGSQPSLGGMMGSQMPSYVAQAQQSSPALEQQRPSFTAEQSRPAASSLPVFSGAASVPSAPATTQQICSCITINPAAPAAAAPQQSAPVSSSSADSAAQQPQQQSFAAPAQQQSYVAPAAQSYSNAPAASSQQGPAQRPSSSGY